MGCGLQRPLFTGLICVRLLLCVRNMLADIRLLQAGHLPAVLPPDFPRGGQTPHQADVLYAVGQVLCAFKQPNVNSHPIN